MQKPRICFVSESEATYGLMVGGDASATVGGAEVQQALLAPALQKLGYSISFLVPDLGQPDEVVTEQGITLIKTREQYKPATGLRDQLSDVWLLFRAMSRAGADIYYQRTSATITGIVALYCKLKRKPFVYSVASNMDLDGTTRRRLKPLHHKLYWYGLTRATAVVVQTEDQMRLLKENLGKDGVLIRSTYPLPDAEEESERRYVLWVGSFRDVRRPEMFIELASRLPQYEFVMVGGPWKSQESMFDEMKARAESVPNMHLTGGVPYKEVGKYFGGAKVFVNTSSVEGFPNTYLQAWSRGLPVIATFDADGLIAKHGLGRYCSSVSHLMHAVDEFMRDDALRASVGEAAIKYVREHHSAEVVAARYDELFMRLCRRKR